MLVTALIMGFAGSLHCAGMCSPLAFAVTSLKGPGLMNRLLYNTGRITTYGVLGSITATIGYIFPLSNFQNLLSIILGSVLIVLAFGGITGLRVPIITAAMIRVTGILKVTFSKYLTSKKPGSILFLGALNGLLPCGLTFLALSFCITFTSPLEGFSYMFMFGVGTLPVMLGVVSIANIFRTRLKWNIGKVTTGLMMLSGLLLIARVFLIHLPDGHTHEFDLVQIVICR